MPLKVIGAGVGRTGTMSLKLALEHLGLGPSYHMISVIRNQEAALHWEALAACRPVDWEAVFAGYQSTTDWPACDYWRELTAHWPDAKVILTTREPQSWFRSTQDTIFGSNNTLMASDTPIGRIMRAIVDRHFGGGAHDRDVMTAALERHNAEVIRCIPADRLLVFDVADGWAPLCGFLGVPLPADPFPRANSTDEFRAEAAARTARVIALS